MFSPAVIFFLHRNVFSIIPLFLLLSTNFVGPYYFINFLSHAFCYIFSSKTLIYVNNYRYIFIQVTSHYLVHRNAFVMSVLTDLFYFIYIILDVVIVVIDHCSDFSIACDRLCYATPYIAHSVF